VGTSIRGRLSPRYQALLGERDMRVGLLQSRFTIGSGNVKVKEIHLTSDAFSASGSGHISLAGRMRLDCALLVNPELSLEVVQAFQELGTLADPYGRLLFPFSVVGPVTGPQIVTDTQYILGRVLPAASGRLVERFIGKGGETAQDAGTGAQDILKKFLQQ
jgi:hypothetical protein